MSVRWAHNCYDVTNLGNSRQIRPPIYSLKQTKLRKRRVIRFAILYFTMLLLFLILLVVPLVLRDMGMHPLKNVDIPLGLLQPLDKNNNNTITRYTGNNLPEGLTPISAIPGTPSPS